MYAGGAGWGADGPGSLTRRRNGHAGVFSMTRVPGTGAMVGARSFPVRPRFPPLPPMVRSAFPRRSGVTHVEQLVVLVVLGLLAALSVASGVPLLDAAAVEAAAQETTDLFALARDHATATSRRTAVRLDAAHARVLVHAGPDTLARGDFSGTGIALEASRDSMAYAPSGLGVGAANLRVILRRGARADTITVSRLGRVHRH